MNYAVQTICKWIGVGLVTAYLAVALVCALAVLHIG